MCYIEKKKKHFNIKYTLKPVRVEHLSDQQGLS